MILGKNISKTYKTKNKSLFFGKREKKSIEALKNINIEIKPEKITGVLGVNGAGKTTLIKILTGQINPSIGEVILNGENIINNMNELKTKTNVISGTEKNIYWRLTAKENLEYFGSLYGINRKKLDHRIDDVLNLVKLEGSKDVPVEEYSKGMKQRLQIARGLINNPEYIFLDEPTLGLDIIIAKEIRDYIKKLSHEEGKGILLTSHYMSEVEYLCDYIYILDNGEIITQGTMEEIKRKYSSKNKYKISLLEDNLKFKSEIKKNLGIIGKFELKDNTLYIETDNDIKTVIKKLDENNIKYTGVENYKLTLEEVIFNIINRKKQG